MFYAGENVCTNPGRRIEQYHFPLPPPFAAGDAPVLQDQYSQPPS